MSANDTQGAKSGSWAKTHLLTTQPPLVRNREIRAREKTGVI